MSNSLASKASNLFIQRVGTAENRHLQDVFTPKELNLYADTLVKSGLVEPEVYDNKPAYQRTWNRSLRYHSTV